jgi:hypothetical protein
MIVGDLLLFIPISLTLAYRFSVLTNQNGDDLAYRQQAIAAGSSAALPRSSVRAPAYRIRVAHFR